MMAIDTRVPLSTSELALHSRRERVSCLKQLFKLEIAFGDDCLRSSDRCIQFEQLTLHRTVERDGIVFAPKAWRLMPRREREGSLHSASRQNTRPNLRRKPHVPAADLDRIADVLDRV